MTLLKITPMHSFVVPDGFHRGKVVDVREMQDAKNGAVLNMVRIVFDIMDASGQYVKYKAGRKYVADLSSGSDFRKDLENWGILGPDDCGEFDPESLTGKEADILIKQHRNPNYPQPYCAITGIFAAGSMLKTVTPQMAA